MRVGGEEKDVKEGRGQAQPLRELEKNIPGPEGLSPNSPALQGQVNDYKSPPNPVPQSWEEGSGGV